MKLLKHLTPDEHEKCASRIRRAEDELYQVLVAVQRAYGVSDRAVRPLEKMVIRGGLLDILKCRMDDHFYHDGHEGQSPYYGRRLTPVPADSPTLADANGSESRPAAKHHRWVAENEYLYTSRKRLHGRSAHNPSGKR